MWRLLTNGEEKVGGDETFCMSGRDFGWYKIRTSSNGSLWLDGDLPVRRKISDTSEAEKPTANTGSPKLPPCGNDTCDAARMCCGAKRDSAACYNAWRQLRAGA